MNRIIYGLTKILSHPLAQGSAVVLVGSTVANIGSYAYHLVVGRMLGPERYGELASLFSFSYILNVPSMVLHTVLTRFIAGLRKDNETGRAKSISLGVMKRLVYVIVAGALLILPLIRIIADFLHISEYPSVFYMYLTSALWLLTVVQTSLLQGFQRFGTAMVFMNVGIFLRLIGGYFGALFGVVETVIAGLVTNAIGLAAYFIPLRHIYTAVPKPSAVSRKDFVGFAAPSLLTILGVTSLYSTDIMLAKHYLPALEAGLYAALSVMGKIVFFASSSVSFVLYPVVAERSTQKVPSRKLVNSALLAVFGVSAAITLGFMLAPKLALGLLFGASYYAASPMLGWFGVFLSVYSMCYLMVMTLLGSGKTRVFLFVVLAAIAQIAGIVFFHTDIRTILMVNIFVTAGLLVALLLYYRHEIKES